MKPNKLFFVFCASFGLTLVGCGPSNPPVVIKEFNVNFFGDHLIVDKNTVTEGTELSLTISVDDPQQWVVPESISKISVGSRILNPSEYSYNPSVASAKLVIPPSNIDNNIGIFANALPRTPEDGEISVYLIGQGLKINKNIIKKGDELKTNITLNTEEGFSPDQYRLPALNEISVLIGDNYFDGTELPPYINYNQTNGLFKIDGGYTTDDIAFFGDALKIDTPVVQYSVTMTGSTSCFAFDGATSIDSAEPYKTNVYPSLGYNCPNNIKVQCGNRILDPSKDEYFWKIDPISGVGELNIPAPMINGDLIIEIFVEIDPYPVFSDELLKYVDNDDGTCRVTGIINRNVSSIVVPTSHNGKTVSSIDKGAFFACKNLRSIQLPFVGGSYEPGDINSEYSDKNFGYIFGDDLDPVDGCKKTTQYSYNYSNLRKTYDVFTHIYNIPEQLKLVTIANNVSVEEVGIYHIPDGAFSGCEDLVKINITESNAISLGYCSFESCYHMSDFVIPSSVRSISSYCFFNANGLRTIYIPSTVVAIDAYAFYQYFLDRANYRALLIFCELDEETVESRFSLGWSATSEDGYVHSVVYNADNEYYEYEGFNYVLSTDAGGNTEATIVYYDENIKKEKVDIPSSITQETLIGPVSYDVTRIGNSCFCENQYIASVTLPKTIKYIGKTAFSNCSKLEEVAFENGNENEIFIDNGAFYLDYNLKKILNFGNCKITELGNSVFESCHSLESLAFPGTLTDIGNYCFYDCSKLTEIINFDKITANHLSGQYIFMSCHSLQKIIFPKNCDNIPTGMFYDCMVLKEISFDSNSVLSDIEPMAFSGCEALEGIDLSNLDYLGLIDDYAFSNCYNLQSFAFPTDPLDQITSLSTNEERSALTLGAGVFLGCDKLGTETYVNFVLPTYVTFKPSSFTIQGEPSITIDYYVDPFPDWKTSQSIHLKHEGTPIIGEKIDDNKSYAECQTFPRGQTTKWQLVVEQDEDEKVLISCQGRIYVSIDQKTHSTCGEAMIIFDSLASSLFNLSGGDIV